MSVLDSTLPHEEGNPGVSPFDKIMLLDHSGQERWSARDLQRLMSYDRWERFAEVLTRAQQTITASGLDPLDHFRGAAKVIPGGRWGQQKVSDYRLTRFGAYHVALAGDGRKPEVAAAKTYFAVKAREAELVQAPAPDVSSPEGILALAQQYVAAAQELVSTKKVLAIAAPKAGKWDAFCDSDGLIDMNAAAKALTDVTGGLGRTKFMKLLRSQEIHFLQIQNRRLPYENHIKAGRAEVKLVQANYQWVEQTFFTGKGLDWLADKLGSARQAAA
ncbi:phage antirepressor KilAC domain-containing protein [Streptomyces sp. ISL-100]|uniref:phage antirepressor KilAC domain-containing protein n=1 Tax=Streptomyces sp. ISL-100 TaxID=2819173 RepID=UPI001BED241C|nr:phage antirepressor KilAC domain-containing protein [Streptomyces sp. ISL-100]MBT2399523.1 phage antirepressor KilAC domain-containing protein [Streptomyces sp. ISL-100]